MSFETQWKKRFVMALYTLSGDKRFSDPKFVRQFLKDVQTVHALGSVDGADKGILGKWGDGNYCSPSHALTYVFAHGYYLHAEQAESPVGYFPPASGAITKNEKEKQYPFLLTDSRLLAVKALILAGADPYADVFMKEDMVAGNKTSTVFHISLMDILQSKQTQNDRDHYMGLSPTGHNGKFIPTEELEKHCAKSGKEKSAIWDKTMKNARKLQRFIKGREIDTKTLLLEKALVRRK